MTLALEYWAGGPRSEPGCGLRWRYEVNNVVLGSLASTQTMPLLAADTEPWAELDAFLAKGLPHALVTDIDGTLLVCKAG